MSRSALALFHELTSVPTAPFFESSVSRAARRWMSAELPARVRVKKLRGGMLVSYHGAGDGPALVLAAHLDHPAFKILSVNARGANARLDGGLPPHLLAGAKVVGFPARPRGNIPVARGVIGARPKKSGHAWRIAWTQKPSVPPAFAILDLPACEIKDGWLNSRSVDDLLGCAVSLEALRQVSRAKMKTNLVVALNRAEEVGFIGALDMIISGALRPEDSFISVESSRELPGSRPGRGPTIRLGDKASQFDLNLLAVLDAAAEKLKKRGTKTQRLRLTGGTCEGTAYQAFGYESAGVAVPLVNYHNGWGAKALAPERVRLSDVDGAVKLLVEAARIFPAHASRGATRLRLVKRHKALAKRLS